MTGGGSKITRGGTGYGWWVLAASFLILFLNAGARMMIGVMIKPIIADFGWSRAELSAGVFLNTVVTAIAVIVAGHYYDRFGPKVVLLVSSALFSAGLMLMMTIGAYWQFLLYYGVIAAAGVGGLVSPLFGAILSKWFDQRRGLAISLATAGTSLGQFALVPLFSGMLLDIGWQSTMLWVGLLCLVVNVVLVLAVIRGDPRQIGKLPYGHHEREAKRAAGRPEPASLGLRLAMRTGSFWLFTVAMFICGAGDTLLTTHLVPMATDSGVSTTTAVAMLAWFGLLSLGGILIAGPASDRIGNRVPIALTFGFRVLLFVVAFVYQNQASFWLLALGFGFTFLITAPLTTTLMGRLYGFGYVGVLGGFITTVHYIGGGLWAYLGGVVYDATGGYSLAMAISAAASGVAMICVLFIREVRHLAPVAGEAGPGAEPSAGAATIAGETSGG